jgi:hypothetical protein
MVSNEQFRKDKKGMKVNLAGKTVYDMMLLEDILSDGGGSSHDVCDKIYDYVICWDLPDEIDEGDEYHYDEAVTDIMKHVPMVAIHGDNWEADVSQFVRDHVDLVYDVSQYFTCLAMPDKNLDKKWKDMEYEEDDSLYQGVRTIMELMPGNGIADQYKLIVDYFKDKE